MLGFFHKRWRTFASTMRMRARRSSSASRSLPIWPAGSLQPLTRGPSSWPWSAMSGLFQPLPTTPPSIGAPRTPSPMSRTRANASHAGPFPPPAQSRVRMPSPRASLCPPPNSSWWTAPQRRATTAANLARSMMPFSTLSRTAALPPSKVCSSVHGVCLNLLACLGKATCQQMKDTSKDKIT